jgi:hypothetical protein
LALRQRAAAGVMLATALLGIVLSFGAFEHIRAAMNDSIEHAQHHGKDADLFGANLRQSVEGSIRIEKQEGFWATIIALVVAATVSGAALTVRHEAPPPQPAA